MWFYLHECGDHRGDEVGGDRWVGKCNTVEHLRCSRSLQILVSLEIERKRERGGIGGGEKMTKRTVENKQRVDRVLLFLRTISMYILTTYAYTRD